MEALLHGPVLLPLDMKATTSLLSILRVGRLTMVPTRCCTCPGGGPSIESPSFRRFPEPHAGRRKDGPCAALCLCWLRAGPVLPLADPTRLGHRGNALVFSAVVLATFTVQTGCVFWRVMTVSYDGSMNQTCPTDRNITVLVLTMHPTRSARIWNIRKDRGRDPGNREPGTRAPVSARKARSLQPKPRNCRPEASEANAT